MGYDVELREIYYILAAQEERNFTRAAERCFISQPALSKVVKRVEKELGVVIFNRKKNPLEITAEGKQIIQYFQEMRATQKNLTNYCNDLKRRRRSELLVGASSYFCTFVLPDVVANFESMFPEWNVRLLEANTSDMLQMIKSNVLDLGICVGNEQSEATDPLVWQEEGLLLGVPNKFGVNASLKKYALAPEVVQSGHIYETKTAPVPLHHFRDERFILLKNGNDGRERMERMCAAAGFTPHIVMEIDQLLTTFTMTAAGAGICLVRAGMAYFMEELSSLITFYKIDSPENRRQVQIIRSARADNLEVVQKLVECLKDYKLPN